MDQKTLELELEEAKSKIASQESLIESLRWQLERSEQSYAELAKQKCLIEEKKHQHDDAFASSIFLAPLGGLALVAVTHVCRLFGLFQGFFQKFSENAYGIALIACGAIISYISIRIYYWKKNEKNKE